MKLCLFFINITAIKWADFSPPRTRGGSARIRADFRRTSGGSAGWTFRADSSGPAADSADVRRGPKNPPRIRCGSATSTRRSGGLFGLEKNRKSPPVRQMSPNQSAADFFSILADYFFCRGLFCPPRIRCGFAADFRSAQKIRPKNSSNYGPLKKSAILKICRRTSGGLRQGGQTSTDEVRLV